MELNLWTKKSIYLANQENYLDLLYKVYPMSPNLEREVDIDSKKDIQKYFDSKDSVNLLNILLEQEIFPIKDSYVAYLKKDKTAIDRNPYTVNRITSMLYEMGLEDIFKKLKTPKETNRQIGPLFKNWINRGCLGVEVTNNIQYFLNFKGNIIFNGTDYIMKELANSHFGYTRDKGLDFIAKFNNKIILGEAKFLTDFGGHQNAQLEDAVSTMISPLNKTANDVEIISILDGVIYIEGCNKMHKILYEYPNNVIVSAVLLRDYLYSL